jgi:purine nucleosidase/pyrimidine-specific ribonucleoside hydrolase
MRPLIIDTDPGIDDALALLFAWGSPEVDVEALTTVAGNVPVDIATRNVFRLLEARRPAPVPVVAVGASAPLSRPLETATRYHGSDGLGDVPGWPPPDVRVAPVGAAALLVEAARRHGERLTVAAIGPLTNLAQALEADRRATMRVGRVVIMGGAVDGPGNVTPSAEFNIHVDPDAAALVFESGLPIDLVPLDATRQAVLTRDRLLAALAKRPGPLADRIAALTERAFRVDAGQGTRGMVLHDPLAIGVALHPPGVSRQGRGRQADEFVEWDLARLTIGADGATRRAPGAPNCRVAVRVHVERFLATFLERITPAAGT